MEQARCRAARGIVSDDEQREAGKRTRLAVEVLGVDRDHWKTRGRQEQPDEIVASADHGLEGDQRIEAARGCRRTRCNRVSLCLFMQRAVSRLRCCLKAARSPSLAACQIGGSPRAGWSVLMKKEGLVDCRGPRWGDSFDRSDPEPASSSAPRLDSLRGGEETWRGGAKSSSSSTVGGLRQLSIEELRAPAVCEGERCNTAVAAAGAADGGGEDTCAAGGAMSFVSVRTSIQDTEAMSVDAGTGGPEQRWMDQTVSVPRGASGVEAK